MILPNINTDPLSPEHDLATLIKQITTILMIRSTLQED